MIQTLTDTDRKILADHTRALNRYVDYERTAKRKETWVKVGIIRQLTGWDKEKMRNARLFGTVVFKKEGGVFFYLVESVAPQLIINRSL